MRIFHVIAGGRHGGAETFMTDLVDALAQRGVDQHAFTRPYAERLARLTNVRCGVTTGRMGGPLDVFSGLKLRRALNESRPDIVLAWMSRAANLMMRGPWINVGRLGGYYDLKYFNKCRYLICNTPDLVDHCASQDWPRDRVLFIPNFSPKIDGEPISKASLTTPESAPVLLILARLEESKGVDSAIRALTSLPDAYLWIAGVGSQSKSLEALALSLGVQARIRFLGWRSDREALLKAADVCLVPSRQEPFGNVIVNAWTAGTPVVAADSPGPRYLIESDVNGILVENENPGALAMAVARILHDDRFAQRLVIGGESQAAGVFSERAVVDAYLDLFSRLTRD